MTDFLFVFILSGVTLLFDLDIEELSYMPSDKRAMYLGVVYLGVPGAVSLGNLVVSMFTVF